MSYLPDAGERSWEKLTVFIRVSKKIKDWRVYLQKV